MIPCAEVFSGLYGFKGRLLLTAGIVVLLAMGWTGGREIQRSAKGAGTPSLSSLSVNWAKGPGGVSGSVVRMVDQWGGAAVPMGVSFMAAMIAASVLRVALKTGLALLLTSGLAIWFLEHEGHVQLWQHYHETVRHGGNWLSMRAEGVGQFLKDHLPSASAACIGFGFGLRR